MGEDEWIIDTCCTCIHRVTRLIPNLEFDSVSWINQGTVGFNRDTSIAATSCPDAVQRISTLQEQMTRFVDVPLR